MDTQTLARHPAAAAADAATAAAVAVAVAAAAAAAAAAALAPAAALHSYHLHCERIKSRILIKTPLKCLRGPPSWGPLRRIP